MWTEYTLFVVEPYLLLADQWEGFTQGSQLQGLAVTTEHQPLLSMEDQLCRGRVEVLCRSCPLGALALGFPGWCRPRSASTCVFPGVTSLSCKAILDGCYLCWAWRFPGEAKL